MAENLIAPRIHVFALRKRLLNTDWKVRSVFVRSKARIAIYGNTSLITEEYGALFSPYSVGFYAVLEILITTSLKYRFL